MFGRRLRHMKSSKTKNRKISDAEAQERKEEIDNWLRTEYAVRAKSRQLIEDYLEGKLEKEKDE